METNWLAQATRLLALQVEAAVVQGQRVFVAGVLTEEPVRVGDTFSTARPGRGEGPERACALRVERILWERAHVSWIDCGKPVELELSGDVKLELATGTELRGESNRPLGPFEVVGRGERRRPRRRA